MMLIVLVVITKAVLIVRRERHTTGERIIREAQVEDQIVLANRRPQERRGLSVSVLLCFCVTVLLSVTVHCIIQSSWSNCTTSTESFVYGRNPIRP